MKKRKGDYIKNFLRNIIYEDKQKDDFSFYLTVKKVFRINRCGELDFGGSEYVEAKLKELKPVEKKEGGKYGWWDLKEGIYMIDFNEEIEDSVMDRNIVFIQPSYRLLRNGVTHPTIILERPGRVETTISVGKSGVKLKENARISKLVFIECV